MFIYMIYNIKDEYILKILDLRKILSIDEIVFRNIRKV